MRLLSHYIEFISLHAFTEVDQKYCSISSSTSSYSLTAPFSHSQCVQSMVASSAHKYKCQGPVLISPLRMLWKASLPLPAARRGSDWWLEICHGNRLHMRRRLWMLYQIAKLCLNLLAERAPFQYWWIVCWFQFVSLKTICWWIFCPFSDSAPSPTMKKSLYWPSCHIGTAKSS